jgi:hypothetical protein
MDDLEQGEMDLVREKKSKVDQNEHEYISQEEG